MHIDERKLGLLIDESEDLHADAMRAAKEPLADRAEMQQEPDAQNPQTERS